MEMPLTSTALRATNATCLFRESRNSEPSYVLRMMQFWSLAESQTVTRVMICPPVSKPVAPAFDAPGLGAVA